MGTSAANEPINFMIIVIYDYDLLIVFSSSPIENSRIDRFTDLLHDFT